MDEHQPMPPDSDRRGDEEWSKATDGADRILSVALALQDPQTAAWIAEEADVSETTARKHLERLVELRVLMSTTAHGVTTYSPDPAYFRFRSVSRYVNEHTKDELTSRAEEIQATLADVREDYAVEEPDELRQRAAQEGTKPEDARTYRQVASEWESRRDQLSVIREALDRYDDYNHGRAGQHSPA